MARYLAAIIDDVCGVVFQNMSGDVMRGTKSPSRETGNRTAAAFFPINARAYDDESNLIETTIALTCVARIFRSATGSINDWEVHNDILELVDVVLANVHGDLKNSTSVLNWKFDIYGRAGTPLSYRFGFAPGNNQSWRVADVTIPVIVEDMYKHIN